MKIFQYFRYGKLNSDHKRNFKVLFWAVILNISFAFEKLFIVLGHPLNDVVWLGVYGTLALLTAYLATKDYVLDVVEEIEHPETHHDHVNPII